MTMVAATTCLLNLEAAVAVALRLTLLEMLNDLGTVIQDSFPAPGEPNYSKYIFGNLAGTLSQFAILNS